MSYQKCLCCGKELKGKTSEGWHVTCIRRFFGTDSLPIIDLSDEKLESAVKETIGNKQTIAGVQKKLSLNLSVDKGNRLTIVNYPTGYILKPQAEGYSELPEFEHLTMQMAALCKLRTVPNALIKTGDEYAYITKRIDRAAKNNKTTKYAMEDFCQLSERLTEDKYKGSYESCAKIIDKFSSRPGFDKTELYMRLIFCFVTGNSDMHLKNFSLMEEDPGSGEYFLSPAYDLLPVNIVMPTDTEETALTLNGRKRKIQRKDFLKLSENMGIGSHTGEIMIRIICKMKEEMLEYCKESYLSEENKEAYSDLIEKRINTLISI